MKTTFDPRHLKRRQTVKSLFADSFTQQKYTSDWVDIILKKKIKLDSQIKKAAPTWPLDKLNRVDLAILRLAVYELLFTETPPKVVIDEAVEIAKEFGAESSPSFVNGVLGTILKTQVDKKAKK
jgi:N utilization substance protein B